MAKPGGVTHLFAELSSLDELSSLLGRSARLKYTCLSVSRKYLALGSNSGGVYIFSRDTLKYLQVVFGDTEASFVVSVSLSPSDHHVAIALSTGYVAVYELNIERRAKPDRVRYTNDHVGHTVTTLTWDATSSKLFAADSTGKISLIFVPTNKSKNLFTITSEVIAYVESAVYQMEWWKDKLLVSTLKHAHLFDTIKQNYSTIGTKSRDGEYGACFFVEPSSKYTVIYCARPGSRMWEVDFEGKVLNTHQFKQLLAVPPIPVITLGNEHIDVLNAPQAGQSLAFYKMFPLSQFIITWSSKGLYLFDPINVKVMIWTQSFSDFWKLHLSIKNMLHTNRNKVKVTPGAGIKDVHVYSNDIYLFMDNSSVHRVTLLPIYQLFTVLSSRGLWLLSSNLLLSADQVGMRQAVIKRINKDLVPNILAGLKSEGKNDVVEKVRASMEDVSEGSIESLEACDDFMDSAEVKGHTYLPSGMVIVSEGVQVKRVWEKIDVKMKNQDKVDTSREVEVSSAHTHKSIDAEDSEFQVKVNHINDYENKEFVEVNKQKESDRYEQIISNEDKMEEGNEVSFSSTFSKYEIVGLGSDKELDSESNLYLQNQHMNTAESVDIETVHSGNSTLENNGLNEISNSAQGDEPLHSVQICCDDNLTSGGINILDMVIDNNFDKDNSSNVHVFGSNIQAIHNDADVLSQQNAIVCDTWSESTNFPTNLQFAHSMFIGEKDINSKGIEKERMPDSNGIVSITNQSIETEPSASSGEAMQTMSQSRTFNNVNNVTSAPGDDKPLLTLLSMPCTVALDDVSYSTASISDSSGDNIAGSSQRTQDAFMITSTESISYAERDVSGVEFQMSSQLDITQSVEEGFQEFSGQISEINAPTSDAQFVGTVDKMATLTEEDLMGVSSNHPSLKFSPLTMLHTDNSDIAQPVKVPKKKKKMLNDIACSVSVDMNSTRVNKDRTMRNAISFGDEQNDSFLQGLDLEMDSISIATISSIEEEDDMTSSDSLSAAGDLDVREQSIVQTFVPELLSFTHPDTMGKPISRKSSTSSYHEDRRSEIIPPLKDRLAAARGTVSTDDMLIGLHPDSLSSSPLSTSGEHFMSVGSSRASLSALKDGISLKLKTQTKSFIKTFKDKNPLTKSSSTPMFPTFSSQQLKDEISHKTQDTEQPDKVIATNELNRIKQLAITAVNTSALYNTALDIQKQLMSSSAIVTPVVLQKILNEWTTEINFAICRYHEELMKRTNEKQEKEKTLQTVSSFGGSTGEIKIGLKNHELKDIKGFTTDASNETHPEHSNVMKTLKENENKFPDNSVTVTSGLGTLSTQSDTPELTTPTNKSLTPTYWTNVVHSDDPFQLPKTHLDLFRTLTTMCFVCGVSGDILNHLNFTEDIHYMTFVKEVLPPSVYALLNPDCHCLMSLLPDSDISVSRPSQHLTSRKHHRTQFKVKNAQNKTFVAPDEIVVGSTSGSTAKVGFGNISQDQYENSISVLNGASSLKEIQNTAVSEMESRICSCKSDLTNWGENEQFKQDVSLALFIRLFFFALDYDKVKAAIDNHNKVFISWTSLVLCSGEMGRGDIVSSILADKQIIPAIDYLRSGILPHQSALLGHVYKLFDLAPSKTSELCGEIWKAITPVDLIQFSILCSKPASVYLLKYFQQAMMHLATVMRPAVFRQLCQHIDVRYLLLESLLQLQSTDVFPDGIRSLATQLKAVLPFDWLNDLLSLISSEEERDRIVQLCSRNGSSAICVKLLTGTGQWQKLLNLIVDLNNINLLKGIHGEDGYIPRNEQEWKFLLQCFHRKFSTLASQKKVLVGKNLDASQTSHQQDSESWLPSPSSLLTDYSTEDTSNEIVHQVTMEEQTESLLAEVTRTRTEDLSVQYESFSSEPNQDDSSQDHTITWHSIGYLLLEHVGGAASIDLLMEHLHDPIVAKHCLKAEFLKACYLDFSIKMEQNHVTHDILEKLSVYMWKKKPDFVPPSVLHSIRAEKKLIEKGEGEDAVVQGLFNQVKALESKDLISEHLSGQWGQEVNMSSNCQYCHIPLKSAMSLTIQGVLIFPCGHAFHKTCVSGPACPILH